MSASDATTSDDLDYKALMATMDLLVEEGRLAENEYVGVSNALKFHKDHHRAVKRLEKMEVERQAREVAEVQMLFLTQQEAVSPSNGDVHLAPRTLLTNGGDPTPTSAAIPSWVRDTMSITF